MGELITGAITLSSLAAQYLSVPGADKRTLVLGVVADVFDVAAGFAVPAIAYPIWIAVRPLVRSIVLAAASGALERILPLILRTSNAA